MTRASIDQLIAEAASDGRLTALTLWPAGKGWQANARNDRNGWNCINGPDPVAALREALTGQFETPSVPPRTEPKPAAKAPSGSVFD